MKIQSRNNQKIALSPGPGEYNIEKAGNLAHAKYAIIDFSKVLGRLNQKTDPNNGPGTYNDDSSFGAKLNKMTIGKRQELKTNPTIGPGSYDPEKADSIVMAGIIKSDFAKSPTRKNIQSSSELGPGHYSTTYNFGQNSPKMTIRTRLSENKEVTLGPGAYDLQDSVTKPRTPAAIIPKNPARFNHQTSYQGSEVADLPEFTNGSKSFTIGVKRSGQISQSIGPG